MNVTGFTHDPTGKTLLIDPKKLTAGERIYFTFATEPACIGKIATVIFEENPTGANMMPQQKRAAPIQAEQVTVGFTLQTSTTTAPDPTTVSITIP